MSTEQEPIKPNKTSPLIYLLAAILSALAGFLAIYVNSGPIDTSGPGVTKQLSDSTKTSTKGSASQQKTGSSDNSLKALSKGEMASFLVRSSPKDVPPFTFENAAGEKRSITEWKGKVVLLNLWATWCAPCRKEMPALDQLKTELGGDDFDVVAISIDRGGRDKPKEFLEQINVKSLEFFIDESGKLFISLKAIGMPTTLLLNREGKEIGRLVGPAEWYSDDAKNLLRTAIGQD